MVPDLRVTMKVGAYPMSDEVRRHLEATGISYLTANRYTNRFSCHKNGSIDTLCVYYVCVYTVRKCVVCT